jgi:hypothetical protein
MDTRYLRELQHVPDLSETILEKMDIQSLSYRNLLVDLMKKAVSVVL